MLTYLWIALGGALGSVARYSLAEFLVVRFAASPPWAVLLINATGSFLIGALAALIGPNMRWAVPADVRLFLMVGLCGGYTTFSSFSLQTFDLLRGGAWSLALANVFGSVVACLVAVALGYSAGAFLGRGG